MIVWWYSNSPARFDTGGRYDPSTDSWTATSTTNAPEARRAHNAVWTGTQMIVWGGEGQPFVVLNTGGRYDPSTRQLDSHQHDQCAGSPNWSQRSLERQ